MEQARAAARLLADAGIHPEVVYTSMLKRAIRTAWTLLEELDRLWVPVHPHWRLNERHYGALEGENWNRVIAERGQAWWDDWRRDYSLRPDPLADDDHRHPRQDRRYRHVEPHLLRGGESVHDIMERIQPVWRGDILPALAAGRSVMVAVHGIAIRALDEMIRAGTGERMKEIANAAPIIYECRPGGRVVAESRRILKLNGAAPASTTRPAGPDGSE